MHHTWRARAGLGVRTSTYNANKKRALRVGIDPRHFQLRTASYEGEKRKKKRSSGVFVAVILSSFVKRRQRRRGGPANQAPKKDATRGLYEGILPILPFFALVSFASSLPLVSPCQATFFSWC